MEHDDPSLVNASVYPDENKQVWIAGFARIQHRSAAALPPDGATLNSLTAVDPSILSNTKKQRFICLFDGSRSPHCRAKTMEASPHNDHALKRHFCKDSGSSYGEADETHLCPYCGKVLPITTFLQHLHRCGQPPLKPSYIPDGLVAPLDALSWQQCRQRRRPRAEAGQAVGRRGGGAHPRILNEARSRARAQDGRSQAEHVSSLRGAWG